MNDKITREEKIRILLEIGGHRWQKNGHDRIYISLDTLVVSYGLRIIRNRSGHVVSARLNDKPIGTDEALKRWNDISGDMKPYYNVTEDWLHGTPTQKATIRRIFKEQLEKSPQLQLWSNSQTEMTFI